MNSSAYHAKALVESEVIGAGTRIWAFAHIMPGSEIGKDCNIGDHCYIEGGSRIGDRVTIKNGVSVWEKVMLEDDVFVGPNVVFTNDPFPISRKRGVFLPTCIEKGVCLGANSTIVCGVTVGSYAFIGAGAVVTKDVPAHALVYGNPAKRAGYLCSCRQKIRFSRGLAACSCGLRYRSRGGAGIQRLP